MADESPEARAYRRGFRQKNRRDDYALDLFQEARAKLATDRARVGQILGELARLYNPLTDGPIVDLPTRAAILSRLDAGQTDAAAALLERRYDLYAPVDDGGREAGASDG